MSNRTPPFTAFAIATVFSLLPAASVAGALALPLLLSVGGGVLICVHWRQLKDFLGFSSIPLAALLIWSAVTILWSPAPDHDRGWKIPVLVALGGAFAAISARVRPQAQWTFATSAFAVLGTLLFVEAVSHFALNRAANPSAGLDEWLANPMRGSVVLLALGFGVAGGWLRYGRPFLAGLVLLTAGALGLAFGMLASLIAFLLGATSFIAALRAPRLAILVSAVVLAFWMLLAPFVTPLLTAQPDLIDALPTSAAHRIVIWDYVCTRILETPWFGHGLGSAAVVRDEALLHGNLVRVLPRHPHSASLHIWYELGAVGAMLAASAIAVGGWRASRVLGSNRAAAASATGLMMSCGVLANVSFSAWQEWWIATILVAAALPHAVLRLSVVDLVETGAYRATPAQA